MMEGWEAELQERLAQLEAESSGERTDASEDATWLKRLAVRLFGPPPRHRA